VALPETLDDAIRGAKSYISRADPVTAQIFSKNATTTLDNGLAYVMPAEDIQQAATHAKARIDAFRESLADQWGPVNRARAQTAREDALQALDRLEAVLASAQPNDMAKALGLDWF
jgi:hypothetical protein